MGRAERRVGGGLGGGVAHGLGPARPPGRVRARFAGAAGQSFGAFLASGGGGGCPRGGRHPDRGREGGGGGVAAGGGAKQLGGEGGGGGRIRGGAPRRRCGRRRPHRQHGPLRRDRRRALL